MAEDARPASPGRDWAGEARRAAEASAPLRASAARLERASAAGGQDELGTHVVALGVFNHLRPAREWAERDRWALRRMAALAFGGRGPRRALDGLALVFGILGAVILGGRLGVEAGWHLGGWNPLVESGRSALNQQWSAGIGLIALAAGAWLCAPPWRGRATRALAGVAALAAACVLLWFQFGTAGRGDEPTPPVPFDQVNLACGDHKSEGPSVGAAGEPILGRWTPPGG
ncbi:MAG: hypothetical protein LBC97_12955 [Bifidobacteriaceae bacterium]|jgi:hypothetical protein|nr:hypothetical protein [Bifidobacteriaceae bacterium]